MNRRPYILIGSLAAVAVATAAVRYFQAHPNWRRKLSLDILPWQRDDEAVDRASEDSFPASDAPSHTPMTGAGHLL